MPTTPDTLALIGNTPLVGLKGPSEATGCDIFGKCEFANPGASIKDRAALFIVEDAEARGMLKPGGTIVEGTAGNTGIGLALVANAKGYKTIIVMPETQSREKMDTLRALGAELVLVPAAPFSSPCHFVHTSRRIAEETPGAVWANQFDNVANRKAHIVGTAEEIWTQMDGRIDGFVCAAGTGGTIAGVGMGLKAKDESITIALADPHGAALYEYYANGELKADGTSVAEGIGQGRITGNLEGAPIDTQFRISDQEGLDWVDRMLTEEGLCLGLSSGINVAGAVLLARQLGPGKRIATILCDTGFRYLSSLFDPEWLASKGAVAPGAMKDIRQSQDVPLLARDGMKVATDTRHTMQRVKVGMIGLAAVVLLIGLASAIFSAANRERPITVAGAPQAETVANMTITNTATPADPANEPLAELGVAPTAAETNAVPAAQPGAKQ